MLGSNVNSWKSSERFHSSMKCNMYLSTNNHSNINSIHHWLNNSSKLLPL